MCATSASSSGIVPGEVNIMERSRVRRVPVCPMLKHDRGCPSATSTGYGSLGADFFKGQRAQLFSRNQNRVGYLALVKASNGSCHSKEAIFFTVLQKPIMVN